MSKITKDQVIKIIDKLQNYDNVIAWKCNSCNELIIESFFNKSRIWYQCFLCKKIICEYCSKLESFRCYHIICNTCNKKSK